MMTDAWIDIYEDLKTRILQANNHFWNRVKEGFCAKMCCGDYHSKHKLTIKNRKESIVSFCDKLHNFLVCSCRVRLKRR